jgi:hypothetical protein
MLSYVLGLNSYLLQVNSFCLDMVWKWCINYNFFCYVMTCLVIVIVVGVNITVQDNY